MTTVTPPLTATEIADKVFDVILRHVEEGGMPEVYSNNDFAYLCDFYASMPWGHDSLVEAIEHLLEKPESQFNQIQRIIGIDFRGELTETLAYYHSDDSWELPSEPDESL